MISYPIFIWPNDERCRTIYVPSAEIAASVDIDIDRLEERFNAQCIQKVGIMVLSSKMSIFTTKRLYNEGF